MISKNTKLSVWKYFKIGDTIINSDDGIFQNKKFEIFGLHGNLYCPLLSVYFLGKNNKNGTRKKCNVCVQDAKLINAVKRPLKKMNKEGLIKMVNLGNLEAKREMMIRINNKMF